MFGIALARLDQVSAQEKERYQALYCGICRTLKERYGQVGRTVLNYDLTFYLMLANSLFEPPETAVSAPCISHPTRQMPSIICKATPYAADLSIALAYHKCLDDIDDDNSMKARIARAVLHASYLKARMSIPEECRAVEEAMARIRLIETAPSSGADEGANAFGDLLATLFSHDAGEWTDALASLGRSLGRLIYLMDAAVDLRDDVKMGSYNPFAATMPAPHDMRIILAALAADVAKRFEMLPLIRDVHLMESVLYSGIWQRFNEVYSDA